jgi:hypothetical protein
LKVVWMPLLIQSCHCSAFNVISAASTHTSAFHYRRLGMSLAIRLVVPHIERFTIEWLFAFLNKYSFTMSTCN